MLLWKKYDSIRMLTCGNNSTLLAYIKMIISFFKEAISLLGDTNMKIRPMLTEDYKEIAELIINELGYPEQKHENIYQRLEVIKMNDNYQTLVCCMEQHVIGFIGLCKFVTYEKGDYISILSLVVSELYQQKGIGKLLLSAATKYALNHGVMQIKVSCAFHRKYAHYFYEKNGFDRTSFTFIKEL